MKKSVHWEQSVGLNHKNHNNFLIFDVGCGCMNSVFCNPIRKSDKICLVLQAATHSVPQKGLSLMKTQWSVSLGSSVAAMMAKAITMKLGVKLKQKTVINGKS